jgi:LacI family transcriptional regulator
MRQRGIGVVEVDYFTPGSALSHVMLDNSGAVEQGVDHLVAHGHRRIAALGSYHPVINPDERVQAFPGALARHGLPLPEEYVRPISPVETDAYALTRELMALRKPPTALFALTGTVATGAYRALRELGLQVPGDVSLLAFDDYPWMDLVTPAIDTLAQPVERLGEETVRVLFEEIRGGVEKPVERLRLPARLLVRGSVRRLA